MALLRKLGPRGKSSEPDELRDIVANLNNVLNSKRGFSFFVRDFGISDFNHLNSREDIISAVMVEVKVCIEQFEPRVKNLSIVKIQDDDVFRLSFRIDCTLRDSARSLSLFMDPRQEQYQVGGI